MRWLSPVGRRVFWWFANEWPPVLNIVFASAWAIVWTFVLVLAAGFLLAAIPVFAIWLLWAPQDYLDAS